MSKRVIIGVDIGGTKCATTLSFEHGGEITIIDKLRFTTKNTPQSTIDELFICIDRLLQKHAIREIDCIGISCGGPLDSKKGLILSPPNLKGWIDIPIVRLFQHRFNAPTALQNDANAGALAEWLWGAGKGLNNIIFLTFGTGMGAGLILNGQLYCGENDLAGEVGHIRLEDDGPVGFGKNGSFEGFCSGNGILRLGSIMIAKWLSEGKNVEFCTSFSDIDKLTTQIIGEKAQAGNIYALEIFHTASKKLGKGISILVDLLNPQLVVLGSIYGRQQVIIEPVLMEVLKQECIDISLNSCKIQAAGLGESIGDYAAAAVAINHLNLNRL